LGTGFRLKFSGTVEGHLKDFVKKDPFSGELARPYLNSPLLVDEIMQAGTAVPDPGGVAGALRWDVPGAFRSSDGTWELVIDPKTKTILHFNFTTR